MKLKEVVRNSFLIPIQIFIFEVFSFLFSFKKMDKKIGTVVGVEEIASILHYMGESVDESVTVNFTDNKYYSFNYDYDISNLKPLIKIIYQPYLLAYLSSKYKNFIYISGSGFLMNSTDGRDYEFKALKKRNCNIICFFTGSDIRSHRLMYEYSKNHNLDVITTYQSISQIGIDSLENEELRKKLALSADRYADIIFNPNVDQMSYIKKITKPFLYFADESKILKNTDKYCENNKLIVVHAPSSPLIKGTPLVRAAVKKLKEEGYEFTYTELIGVPNSEVLEALRNAHIVLNEFYAFVPGVFGIEAMMNNTVLLTSADKNIEPTLFGDANEAWVVTPYWLIYDKLRIQLDKPMVDLKKQADRGTEWVEKYCTQSFSSKYINDVIRSLNND